MAGQNRWAVLGMAFKGDIDDMRGIVAFSCASFLLVECQEVLCTDEYARLPWFVPLEEALARADAVIIAAPHSRYRSLDLDKPFRSTHGISWQGGLVNL